MILRRLASRARARRRAAAIRAGVLEARLRLVLDALGLPEASSPADLRSAVSTALESEGADAVWLTLAVLRAELPEPGEVQALTRRIRPDGADVVLDTIASGASDGRLHHRVNVVRDRTLVDIHQLLRTPFTTGIQRVTRETVARWARDHTVSPIAWTQDFHALRPVGSEEFADSVRGTALDPGDLSIPSEPTSADDDGADGSLLVPWRCTYLLPELALDPPRTARTQALAIYSRCRTGAIAHDLVPITFATTTDQGVPADFARQLAAVRHFDRLAAISEATRTEYEGWRVMTSAIGVAGPDVVTVELPGEAGASNPVAEQAVLRRYGDAERPLVLCVGSHEPRKNHLAVLHAAELAWRHGAEFRLLFVGGNSWAGGPFVRRLAELTVEGRPVESVAGIADDELWALYRLSRLTIFPSLSEGFGLPAAESLAAGTPVITSDFGSMAEIARHGGAVLVDPRDEAALGRALTDLVTDDDLHRALRDRARARPIRSWDDYARECWQELVGE